MRIPLHDPRLLQQGRSKYSLEFCWESGGHRLDAIRVSLKGADGSLIAADEHLGSTGLANVNNRYFLDLSSQETWERVMAALPEEATQPHQSSAACKKGLWLEAQVRCHGGNESSGAVLWRKEGSALAASKPVTAVVIGAGQRGTGYSEYALDFPHLLKIVAVADPREAKRETMQKLHSLDDSSLFSSWEELIACEKKVADIALIATPDRVHCAPAIAMAKKGYHILLEKPMAVTEEDCQAIVEAVEEAGVMFAVCHVLRYTPCNRKIKDILTSGQIGDVVNISHTEPVGFWHFAHSYVRGNWKQEATSSSSLMAKCCHDIDLIRYWMGLPCSSLSSLGSLNHFRPEKQPPAAGGAKRCVQCPLQDSCQFSAKSIYLEPAQRGLRHWPVSVLVDGEVDIEGVTTAVREGPYGQCVYHCDNDVCDNQIVTMEFEDNRSASLTMIAFTQSICQRETKIYGTKGELTCRGGEEIAVFDFETRTRKEYGPFQPPLQTRVQGHGGADFYLVDAFVSAVSYSDPSLIRTGPQDALASHLLVFRAEQARKQQTVVSGR